MLDAPPPHSRPVNAVATHYFGAHVEGGRLFRSLADLELFISSEMTPLVPNLSG